MPQRLLEEARIPPRYRRCDLETFVTYPNEKLLGAVKQARRFAQEFPGTAKGPVPDRSAGHRQDTSRRRRASSGDHQKGARGLFYDVRDLLRVIRSTYNPLVRTAEMDILRPVMEADLLVLDDIGAEKTSEWVEETMNLIVNTRYNERRQTIFTTNYEDMPDDTDPDWLKPHRLPDALAPARNVRVPRIRRRRLPRCCRPTAASTIWSRCGRSARAAAAAAPAARPAPERPAVRRRPIEARRTTESKRDGISAGPAASRELIPHSAFSNLQCHQPSMLGLYFHIPFCSSICSYCNFNRGLFDGELKDRYVDAPRARDSIGRSAAAHATADTIFFGGGTPSLLDPPKFAG